MLVCVCLVYYSLHCVFHMRLNIYYLHHDSTFWIIIVSVLSVGVTITWVATTLSSALLERFLLLRLLKFKAKKSIDRIVCVCWANPWDLLIAREICSDCMLSNGTCIQFNSAQVEIEIERWPSLSSTAERNLMKKDRKNFSNEAFRFGLDWIGSMNALQKQ